MVKRDNRRPLLHSRIDDEELQRTQRVADELYDGNLSLLVRVAVRQFVDRHSERQQAKAESDKAA